MSDETIRTKALSYTRDHWKSVLHVASWAMAALVAYEFSQGHKQAETEMTAKDFQELKVEVHNMHGELTQVKESQARVEGTVAAIIPWAQGAAKFQAAVQQGAKEALETSVPKGPSAGHRARKP